MLPMQRWLAVAHGVGIFDVVMHQRGLVKNLDRDGGVPHCLPPPGRNASGRTVGDDRIKRRQRDERAQKLAAPGQKFPRHTGRCR